METLKKQLLAVAFLLIAHTLTAQNDGALLNAFSESYTQEYNKQYAEAIKTLQKAYQDNSYETNLRLGWLCYLSKNYTLSKTYYQKAVALKPYATEPKLGLTKALAALESWDYVLKTYEEILKTDPQNYTANYWSGAIYYNRGQYDKSARLFEKIVNLYPFDYDANHMLAWTYLFSGRTNEAKLLFQKALLNRPSDSSCLEGLKRIK